MKLVKQGAENYQFQTSSHFSNFNSVFHSGTKFEKIKKKPPARNQTFSPDVFQLTEKT